MAEDEYLVEELADVSDLLQGGQHPLVILQLFHKAVDPLCFLRVSILRAAENVNNEVLTTKLMLKSNF